MGQRRAGLVLVASRCPPVRWPVYNAAVSNVKSPHKPRWIMKRLIIAALGLLLVLGIMRKRGQQACGGSPEGGADY